jgi:hypothetical protein
VGSNMCMDDRSAVVEKVLQTRTNKRQQECPVLAYKRLQ